MLNLSSTIAVLLAFATFAVPLSASVPKSVSAKDFGAKGDGVTDDTAAIQKALDTLKDGGGVVHLPAGKYVITASLNVPHHSTLMGEGVRWKNGSTCLVVPKNGYSAVTLGNAASVKGLVISYPNNRNNAKPEAYPPSILLAGINPSVENIVFDCAWIGISTPPSGGNAGQGLFRDITGFVHHVGIHLSGCRDVNRLQDIHWFVGGEDTKGQPSYYRLNRVGFEFGHVDGIIMDGCFMIGGKTFYHQMAVKDGPDGKKEPAHSLGHHIDQCWVEDVNNGFIFEGANGFVLSGTNILVRGNGVGVSVKPTSLFYNAVINGVQVRSFGKPVVGFEYGCSNPHPRNRLSIADCQVIDGAPAVHLMNGAIRANIHDCHLQSAPGNPAIQIDKGADLFTITNNVLSAQEAIKDESGSKARKTISGNLTEEDR